MKPSFSSRLHLSPFFPVFSQWRKKCVTLLFSRKNNRKERETERKKRIFIPTRITTTRRRRRRALSLSLFIWWWCYERMMMMRKRRRKKWEKWRARKKISSEKLLEFNWTTRPKRPWYLFFLDSFEKKTSEKWRKKKKNQRSTTALSSNASKNAFARHIRVHFKTRSAHYICWPTKGRRRGFVVKRSVNSNTFSSAAAAPLLKSS